MKGNTLHFIICLQISQMYIYSNDWTVGLNGFAMILNRINYSFQCVLFFFSSSFSIIPSYSENRQSSVTFDHIHVEQDHLAILTKLRQKRCLILNQVQTKLHICMYVHILLTYITACIAARCWFSLVIRVKYICYTNWRIQFRKRRDKVNQHIRNTA